MKLFAGSSNEPLAQDIASLLETTLNQREIIHFADGEIRPWIQEDVRNEIVFVIQSFSSPMNDHIMELILLCDAIRRGAPRRIIGVIPYFGYARQDRQHRSGEPVSARVVAKMLEVVPMNEVITIDLHNDAIVGFFRIPVLHLSAIPILAKHLSTSVTPESVVVSPDVGGVKRARNLAEILGTPIVVMEKKRNFDKADVSEAFQIIGDVANRSCIILDDIISTGGTIANSAQALMEAGAKEVRVAATHGVFSGDAFSTLKNAPITETIVTDTITRAKQPERVASTSVAAILAQAIQKVA